MGLLLFTLVVTFGINGGTLNPQPTAIIQATSVNAATSLTEEPINILPEEIKITENGTNIGNCSQPLGVVVVNSTRNSNETCDQDHLEEPFSAFMEIVSVYWAAIALIVLLHIVCLYYICKISVERKQKPENYDSDAEKIYEEWDPLTMWQAMA